MQTAAACTVKSPWENPKFTKRVKNIQEKNFQEITLYV